MHFNTIKENNLCETCHVIDYLEHFFVYCVKVQKFWNFLKSIAMCDINKTIHFTPEAILFGIDSKDSCNYTLTERKYLNYMILVGKMCISKYKYGKIKNVYLIFEQEWSLRGKTVDNIKRYIPNLNPTR